MPCHALQYTLFLTHRLIEPKIVKCQHPTARLQHPSWWPKAPVMSKPTVAVGVPVTPEILGEKKMAQHEVVRNCCGRSKIYCKVQITIHFVSIILLY